MNIPSILDIFKACPPSETVSKYADKAISRLENIMGIGPSYEGGFTDAKQILPGQKYELIAFQFMDTMGTSRGLQDAVAEEVKRRLVKLGYEVKIKEYHEKSIYLTTIRIVPHIIITVPIK